VIIRKPGADTFYMISLGGRKDVEVTVKVERLEKKLT
jgi:hypothetical protein